MSAVHVQDQSTVRDDAGQRPFRLLDLMILTAATAIGFGLLVAVSRAAGGTAMGLLDDIVSEPLELDNPGDWCVRLIKLAVLVAIVATPLTVALIPIQLLNQRPRFRRMPRQPGLMASGAVSFVILVGLCACVPALIRRLAHSAGDNLDVNAVLFLPMAGGLAVSVSWLTLLAGWLWRTEPNWLDRLGRVMGALWIVLGLALCTGLLIYDQSYGSFLETPARSWLSAAARVFVVEGARRVAPYVALGALALISIGLFRCRWRIQSLGRQPGLMGSCSLAVAILTMELPCLALAVVERPDSQELWRWLFDDDKASRVIPCCGLAVLVCWLTMLAIRSWRAEPTWIDRLGRALGVFWIVAGLATILS